MLRRPVSIALVVRPPAGLSPKRLAFQRSSLRPSMPLYSFPNLLRSLLRLLLFLVRRRRPLLRRALSPCLNLSGWPEPLTKTIEARCPPHRLCPTTTKMTLTTLTITFQVRIMVCTTCIRQRMWFLRCKPYVYCMRRTIFEADVTLFSST